jgi:transcription-repair coupling factor (superfamily II helicase)
MKYTELLLFLRTHSYQETAEVTQSGDLTVRGDTIVWWPVLLPYPCRSHFFGEELEKTEARFGEIWTLLENSPELHPNQVPTEHGTIRPGEYVVHPHHGVGIFEYVATRETESGRRSFVSLEYAGNDKLLFPLERQEELMPYIGSRHPRLTRLYSKAWQKTRERVQKNLIGVARELLKIYAHRQRAERPCYAPAVEWDAELRRSAGFELTEDQARAVEEIGYDLGDNIHPMDRLLCGDVGFGKTEVALHALVRVVQAGRQAALIAPTTVLAEQHYVTLQKRLAGLPIRVERLSRLTAGSDKEIVAAINRGQVDVVVGTHRILAKDITFPNLGLLVVDEEQKFGVAQKEKLKDLRPQIDYLAMSATPIPRTLSMSLSGLRGLSILRTPPPGRRSVETIVGNYGHATLQKALQYELGRGGQVYVVHNRVQSIAAVHRRVEEEIVNLGWKIGEGGKTVGLAHGQMDIERLEKTMGSFLDGHIDVLVASSIVEHGLDSPGANTLVVLHSEWFGLSDLYQLRGRVGRRREQAYAYFLIGGIEHEHYQVAEELGQISATAKLRLKALQEADELGSGWSVAMRDLEIRGGGNILGHEQHGSMESIGLLLYAQLLQEEIGRQARRAGLPLFGAKAARS